MADEKISQLSDAGAPQDTDQLVIARSGSSLSLLFSALKAAIPGGVTSVFTRTGAVTAQTGDYTAAQVGALPSTETLDQIATANVTAANWSNNSHKITSLANGSGAQDAAAFGQIPTALPPSGTAGGDLSGTYPNPAVAPAANVAMGSHKLTGLAAGSGNGDSLRYEQLIGLYLLLTGGTMSGAIAMGAHKITGLTNGSASDDAAAFGQIPTALPPNGTAGGDLSGTYPNPAVKAITETSGPTDLTIGTVTDGQFLKRVGSTLVSAAVGSGTPTDGWVDDTADTWTYASGSGGGTATFTISGVDRTAVLTPGTRIKLTQTTVKYFTVASSTFSTNTTVTITGGSDYTLANAAISANFHSYMANPQGYPGWFNWAPAPTGYSGTPTSVARFSVVGRKCTFYIDVSGTSNANTAAFTLPIPIGPGMTDDPFDLLPYLFDNSVRLTAPGLLAFPASGSTVNTGKVMNSTGGWTSSGTKTYLVTSEYEI